MSTPNVVNPAADRLIVSPFLANRVYLAAVVTGGTRQRVNFIEMQAGQTFSLTAAGALQILPVSTILGGSLDTAGALASSLTRFASPISRNSALLTLANDDSSFIIPRAGTIKNLFVTRSFITGTTRTDTLALAVNGVASAVTTSLATTALTASDVVNSAAVTAGQRLSVILTSGATAVTTCTYAWGFELQ